MGFMSPHRTCAGVGVDEPAGAGGVDDLAGEQPDNSTARADSPAQAENNFLQDIRMIPRALEYRVMFSPEETAVSLDGSTDNVIR
jgi:hypothetical protein